MKYTRAKRLAESSDVRRLIDTIPTRWRVQDWDVLYPWWRVPAKVRILLYADSSVRFSGGSFRNRSVTVAIR